MGADIRVALTVLVLEALRAARFSILAIERRHETAGLIATDVFRRAEVWLVDIGLDALIDDRRFAGAIYRGSNSSAFMG